MQKQLVIISLAFLFTLQTKAQNNIPPRTSVVQQPNVTANIFKINSVTLSIDSSVHVTSGAGATKNYFKAVINYTGPGTIQYQWVLINVGAASQPSTVQSSLQLSGTGTDVLFTERDHVTNNSNKKLKLQIISPVQMESNTITF